MCAVSMVTPGPIVEDTVTDLRYLPLAAGGFALTTLSTSACALATRFSVVNDILPTGACTMPVLSTRNSTLPALISLIACATFGVTVPVFGFGMRPRGPSTLPRRPTARIMCSACLGSTPSRIAISTVSSNLVNFTFCRRGIASSSVYGRSSTCAAAAVNFLPCFAMCLLVVQTAPVDASHRRARLTDDVDAHGARGSTDGLDRRVQAVAVQIRHLRLRDVLDLLGGHRADL